VALQPCDRLIELLLKRGTLHVDETPVPHSIPAAENQTRLSLAYRSNDLEEGSRIIVFDYRGGRSGEPRAPVSGDMARPSVGR